VTLVHAADCAYFKDGVCNCVGQTVELPAPFKEQLVRDWVGRARAMLKREKATPEQEKQFWALPVHARKQIIRNFDRKVKLKSDPHGAEKIRAAQEKRRRQVERQLKDAGR
jgi:hypothetical protein